MTTLLYTHLACFDHRTGPHHPESPERLRAVLDGLSGPAFAALERREAPRAERGQIARVHETAYIEGIFRDLPAADLLHLDADTVVSAGSGEAALRAAGAVAAAVDAVIQGEAQNAFCAVRPPGHHAEPGQAMGFCLFNNVAIGALQARAVHGLQRIAVVDFDVHHGNGTQAVFWADPDLFYGSTHQWPLYPGSGRAEERGAGRGNIVNMPLAPQSGSAEFRAVIETVLLPRLEEFSPQLVLVSAGFDAHAADPLANLNLVEADFAWVTEMLLDVAARHAQSRLVSTLEGGYDLRALAGSVAAHVAALMARLPFAAGSGAGE